MTNTLTAKNPNSQRYVPQGEPYPCDRPGHDEDACADCQKSLAEGRAENEPADFAVENHGTIFLLYPLTDAARECGGVEGQR